MRKYLRPLLLLFAFLNAGITVAQVTTATISGTVGDSTGAVVAGAIVTIRNVDTGNSRKVTTDTAGRYTAPQLSLGKYEVTVEATGFQTVVRQGIELTVGAHVPLNFTLQVGAVTEQITVTGEAPLVETATSTVSGLVNQAQMRDLPLNARSYEQFAFLQPTVLYHRNSQLNPLIGFAPKISASAMRVNHNAYLLDGIDVADSTGDTPGSAAGQLMGVETLREFRVLTNNYSPEYGNALGAIIDVASRGGSNELHGTLFEFLRNSALDARSFFDAETPPFRRNQFGGVLGGRIVKDRLFFFGSYEALRERLTTTQVVFVPTAQARQGILPDPADPSRTRTIQVAPAVVPYLALYPTPEQDVGGGLGRFSYPFGSSTREDFVSGRWDYQHSNQVSYFARYSWDDTDRVVPLAAASVPPWAQGQVSRNQTLTLAETRIFNPQVINEFRAGFVRYNPRATVALTGPDPQLKFPNTFGAGSIVFSAIFGGSSVAGLGVIGSSFNKKVLNTYQVKDTLSYVRGSHSFKTGFNLERFQDNVNERSMEGFYSDVGTATTTGGPYFTFASLEGLLQGLPITFIGPVTRRPMGTSGRTWLWGFFLQDDYHVRSNLTLNLGLRYEFVTPYTNNNDRFIIQNDLFGTPKTGQHEAWGMTCAGCVDPRIGFAWDVFSNGKTALKGGFGVFRSQLLRVRAIYNIPQGTPGGITLTADNPSFPDPSVPRAGSVLRFSDSGSGSAGVDIIPKDPKVPSALHYNLTVDQQITANTMLRLAYVGTHGYHIDAGYTVNTNTYEILPDGRRFYPAGIHRIRPDYGPTRGYFLDFNSWYNALTMTVRQRMTRGLALEASYGFSRATDDASVGLRLTIENGVDPAPRHGNRGDYHGLSSFDMRHRFVSNFTYDFPALDAQNAFARKALSGWQLNSIITLQVGTPFTPWVGFDRANARSADQNRDQLPDLNPSLKGAPPVCPCTLPASLGGGVQRAPERYFDPTAFALPLTGTYGNAGRGIMVGPGLVNFDFALVKNTPITERLSAQFRAEGFNLFNNVNWQMPNLPVFQSNGSYAGGVGTISGTTTTGRQLQFALKLLF